jgi:3-phosphoshikimate 1-carboxyvinyltransferase
LSAHPVEVVADGASGRAVSGTEIEGGLARIHPAARLRGVLRVPGDKSITHRALILAALTEGESRVLAGSDGFDCNSTAGVLGALGVEIERTGTADGGRVDRLVRSPGRSGLRQPEAVLDCGNSGTTLRLVAGVLAGLPVRAVLDGDTSLRRRPVARIIAPLRRMGAALHARDEDTLPPVTVTGRTPLLGIDFRTPVPSAQVKSAILLAGLSAQGTVIVRETVATRDHTERMLRARGVELSQGVEALDDGVEEYVVSMHGGQALRRRDEVVPGDLSAAAFWLVAGAAHPDAELRIEGIGVNPTRRATIDLLRRMGASIEERPSAGGTATGHPDTSAEGEPIADLVVQSSRLQAIDVGPAETAAAIDEIPVLCVAAACAHGTTRFRGIAELRHKESDRVAGMAEGLAALGVEVSVDGNNLAIIGNGGRVRPIQGASGLRSHDDHRLAMAFAIAGLLADGDTVLDGAASVPVSYPGFFTDLERVRA